MSTNKNTVEGQVIELFAGNIFNIKLQSGKEIKAHLAGKMKLNKIKVLIGDKVEVVLDPYGGNTTNRIVRRN